MLSCHTDIVQITTCTLYTEIAYYNSFKFAFHSLEFCHDDRRVNNNLWMNINVTISVTSFVLYLLYKWWPPIFFIIFFSHISPNIDEKPITFFMIISSLSCACFWCDMLSQQTYKSCKIKVPICGILYYCKVCKND